VKPTYLLATVAICALGAGCSPSILNDRIKITRYPNMLVSSNIYAKGSGIILIGNVSHSIGHYPTHGYMKACATWYSGNRECKERFVLMTDSSRRREIPFKFGFNGSPDQLMSMELEFIRPEKSRPQ